MLDPQDLNQSLSVIKPNFDTTEAVGIHQSDIIIRTALVEAIADLRANPYLLDYCFASLRRDDLTSQTYGQKEIDQAKRWFLRTDIPVVMDYRFDSPDYAMISISLVESVETDVTLGDVHYVPSETSEATWPALAGPFTPTAWDPTTGQLTLPEDVSNALLVTNRMQIISKTGVSYPIVGVIGREIIQVDIGTNDDFRGATIRGNNPRLVQQVESLNFRETYRVGAHSHGDPFYLTWLHSIVVFCLLRYKQTLLESRGFERSTISSSQFAKDLRFGNGENAWTRFVNVTGFVRQSWPKFINDRIESIQIEPVFSAFDDESDGIFADEDFQLNGFATQPVPPSNKV